VCASRLLLPFLTVAGLVGVAVPAAAASADAGPPPRVMASLGDSITRGFNACGFFVDCTSRSWSTGDARVNSHYLRIRAVDGPLTGHNDNDARTGAVAADVAGQAATAVGQHADYVTLLIGANDACTATEAAMTPVATFRGQVDAALGTINAGRPDARILVLSIPDIKHLWQVQRGNLFARAVWDLGGVCQSMLANAGSNAAGDNARRDRVRQRVVDYNAALAASCAAHAHCRFDGNAVFGTNFTTAMVSNFDFFHPNATGQTMLAQVSYAAGFGW
jgi:lysophospholipase L1-like esterase